ncbi:helix-turn-helix transcriptional regulator [Campylobacter sp. RM16190]|uniref:helix-turn-helix domain-containing protein n=1 Tax=Campylobacter sp. RM16190 TaxID=1705727 RepID=UPI001475B25C|nr:helix-turn-helix transcriptional regulator [Campylobacter sp. RM16190]
MLIHERINKILKQKNMKKKDFAAKFIEFEPTLKSTGAHPSLPTIYNYLNGTREIKADLIPAMAKALDVSEQELFLDDDNCLEFFKNFIKKSDDSVSGDKKDMVIKLIELCEYASTPLLQKIIETLEKNKEMTINSIKSIGL